MSASALIEQRKPLVGVRAVKDSALLLRLIEEKATEVQEVALLV